MNGFLHCWGVYSLLVFAQNSLSDFFRLLYSSYCIVLTSGLRVCMRVSRRSRSRFPKTTATIWCIHFSTPSRRVGCGNKVRAVLRLYVLKYMVVKLCRSMCSVPVAVVACLCTVVSVFWKHLSRLHVTVIGSCTFCTLLWVLVTQQVEVQVNEPQGSWGGTDLYLHGPQPNARLSCSWRTCCVLSLFAS